MGMFSGVSSFKTGDIGEDDPLDLREIQVLLGNYRRRIDCLELRVDSLARQLGENPGGALPGVHY